MNYINIFTRLAIIISISEIIIMLLFSIFNKNNELNGIYLAMTDDILLLLMSYIPIKIFVYSPLKDYFLLQIKESNMLSDALKGSGESIIITDKNACIIYVNKSFSKVTGFSYEDIIGKKPSVLSSGKQSKLFYKDMWSSLLKKGTWNGELWNKKKDGTLYIENLDIREIKDKKNNIMYYVGIFSDISEKKAIENAICQSQRLETVGTLVGGVAHNFNNLLAAIMGKAYLAKRNDNPEIKNKLLTDIEKLSNDSSELIRQLLTFARETDHRKEKVFIGKLLIDSVSTAKFGLTEKIIVKTDFTDEILPIYCDPVHIKQVIINIINNARDALKESKDKIIKVSLRKVSGLIVDNGNKSLEKDYAEITIEDKGTGIEGVVMDKIFNPFFTTKSINRGTGLGLSTSIGTIKDHDGEIKVISQIDKGTKFIVYLPINKNIIDKDVVNNNRVIHSNKKETILIVDDNKDAINVLSDIVEDFGYIPICAQNGSDALEKYIKNKYTIKLVLTDIVMPIMDGTELIFNIRKINETIPVIMLTGYDMDDFIKNNSIIKNNHTLILPKPVNVKKLSKDIFDIMKKGMIDKI